MSNSLVIFSLCLSKLPHLSRPTKWLRRFLGGRTGCNWDKVYAEVCKKYPELKEYVPFVVATETCRKNGSIYGHYPFGTFYVDGLYVWNGILQRQTLAKLYK